MNERRKFLAGLAGTTPTTVAATGVAAAGTTHHHATPAGGDRNAFPDIEVETHDGRRLKLYSDLIQGRVVTINFMSIDNEPKLAISAKIRAVAKELGDRVGRDVTMISITTDPSRDSVERLAGFAREMGAPDGWVFVRALDAAEADQVAGRLYRHGRELSGSFKIDVVHYGNDGVGLWAAFPAEIRPDDAAMRVTWVMKGTAQTGPLRQAGPRRLDEPGPTMSNRIG